MKNSICGFNQSQAVKLGLKSDDLLVLRWLVDFSASPKMVKQLIGGEIYYWVIYKAVLEDLPVLDISKDRLKRGIMQRLVNAKVLKHQTVKQNGTFSVYAFAENYDSLICSGSDKREPYGENAVPPTVEAPQQKTLPLSNLSSKKDNNTPEKQIFSGVNVSDEVNEFVDSTYPARYLGTYGKPHPKLATVQRIRTKQILQNYLDSESETVDSLDAAAEEFLDSTPTDGNIRAFADVSTIDTLLCRLSIKPYYNFH